MASMHFPASRRENISATHGPSAPARYLMAMPSTDAIFTLPQPALAVDGGGLFPVRRIYCVGRNYAAHAREMGGDPGREPPFFFCKPADAVQPVAAVAEHPMPPLTADYQPEVELVACLGSGGREIAASDALACVFGYAVGLDMTRRDAQRRMKDARRPWETAKSFDRAAPVGPVVPVAGRGHPRSGAITLHVNGVLRQSGDLSEMTWSVAEQIAELSRWSELKAGDLIMTGTPAGVGAVRPGDTLLAAVAGLPALRLAIV